MSDQHYTLAEIEALDLSIEGMALIRAVSPTVEVSSITGGHRVTFTDVVGDTTMDVMDGAPGVGVPSGGSTGQVLKKKSNTDYDTEWGNESGGSGVPSGGSTGQVLKKKSGTDYDTEWGSVPSAATSTPSDLGTAAVGSSSKYAKEDHVHKMPTASDVGAVASGQGVPSGGTSGQYLKKSSNSDYATEWGSISVPSASSATPQPLGTAAAGSSGDYARADHVHAKPTAADIGAVSTADYNPESKTSSMTQKVGKDSNGKLWTEPGSGGGETPWNHVQFSVSDESERTTSFVIQNDGVISEIYIEGTAICDSYDGLHVSFGNNKVVASPVGTLSDTNKYFTLYVKRIFDVWMGRGGFTQWNGTGLNAALEKISNITGKADGTGNMAIASRWKNKTFLEGTELDVWWR